jgi:hypothetical protein
MFVTTWQMVATRVNDRRNVRKSGEQNPSVDELIAELRQQGLRIGVVVDEAHHGFHGETQAAAFFRSVLAPCQKKAIETKKAEGLGLGFCC